MIEMGRKDIFPAVNGYIGDLCRIAEQKQALGISAQTELSLAKKLSADNAALFGKTETVETLLAEAKAVETAEQSAHFFAERLLPAMQEMRAYADEMEQNTAKKAWPFPTYGDILFSV